MKQKISASARPSYVPPAVYLYFACLTLVHCGLTDPIKEEVRDDNIVRSGQLLVHSGDEQIGYLGSQLKQPLSVMAKYDDDSPARGETIEFRIVEGPGSILGEKSTKTAENGTAQISLRLGHEPGLVKIEAHWLPDQDNDPIRQVQFQAFSSTAILKFEDGHASSEGVPACAGEGETYDSPIHISLTGPNNEAIIETIVRLDVLNGSITSAPTIAFDTQPTDSTGVASFSIDAGGVEEGLYDGSLVLTASVPDLVGVFPQTFEMRFTKNIYLEPYMTPPVQYKNGETASFSFSVGVLGPCDHPLSSIPVTFDYRTSLGCDYDSATSSNWTQNAIAATNDPSGVVTHTTSNLKINMGRSVYFEYRAGAEGSNSLTFGATTTDCL